MSTALRSRAAQLTSNPLGGRTLELRKRGVHRTTIPFVFCASFLSAALTADAQVRSDRLPATIPDTTLIRPVVQYLFETLASYIARASRDTLTRPWKIDLGSSEPPWPAVEQHLRVALRGRPVTPSDSQFHHLSIRPTRIAGDTAWYQIVNGLTRICPDAPRRGGYTNVDNIHLVRSRAGPFMLWGPARSGGVEHGDSSLHNCRLLWW